MNLGARKVHAAGRVGGRVGGRVAASDDRGAPRRALEAHVARLSSAPSTRGRR